jgi:parallel beta-helix repeat protein
LKLRKKLLTAALILALFLPATAITQFVRFSFAQASLIYITPDGNVSPSTAPIQRFGDLYTLTSDISGPAIVVGKSNITIDGAGHTIQGVVPVPVSPGQIGQTTNYGGIYLDSVQNVTVKGFSIKYCPMGIDLEYCSNIIVSGNNISRTWDPLPYDFMPAGVAIRGGENNLVTGNRFENNMVSILVWDNSKQNVIVGNTISGSTEDGIRLYQSSGNTFYHNNFDNAQNVYDNGFDLSEAPSINSWDNGEEGNFWNDYNGTDANGDGIGDTPHKLYFMNQDSYPLMKPWEPTPIDNTPPVIAMLSPQNTTYTESSISLNFSTNEPVSWLGYSLDGQEPVTINGNTTIIDLPNGLHNVTVHANDTFGNAGKSETVSFTVAAPESFPTAAVATASVASVTLAGVGVLVYFRKRNH